MDLLYGVSRLTGVLCMVITLLILCETVVLRLFGLLLVYPIEVYGLPVGIGFVVGPAIHRRFFSP